jgi:hypothetical protein
MNTARTCRISLGAFLLLAVVALPAEAQLGRLKQAVKDRVESAVTGETPAAAQSTASPAGRPLYNADVLEMSAEVLDRLARALDAEHEARSGPDRYTACVQEVIQGPEMLALLDTLERETEAARNEREEQAAVERHTARTQRLLNQKCSHLQSGGSASDTGRNAGQFSERQYSVLKERVKPFCSNAAALRATEAGGRVGNYAYSSGEVEVLRPRCAALLPKLERTT